MSDLFSLNGAILGLDHGLKFIGVAISRRGILAEPLQVIQRKSKKQDFAKLNQIIAAENIMAIVLGLPPVPPDFVGHSQADTVRNWATKLAQAVTPPIYFWEEGLSSVDAQAMLNQTDSRNPERIDAHAAAVILQTCLDAVRDEGRAPQRFIPAEEN